MRRPPFLLTLLVGLGLVLAACGSPSASGTTDASTDGAPSQQSSEPEPSQGGGGGGIGTGTGSIRFQISGGYTGGGEFPFLAGLGSYFQQAGVTYLAFGEDESNTDTAVLITLSDAGNYFVFGSPDITIPGATCDWNISRNDATAAAGSFTCDNQLGIGASGQTYTDLDISGSFEASL